ncbi:MAG: cytochrome C [Deltaproteobacteria bacterium]|nr:MAG: cytochrome C [Deltaproteobacteria bacterium]
MRLAITVAALLLTTMTARADSYEEHDYSLNCSGCHRMDGSGSSVVPSFHKMPELNGKPGVREYWIQVPGAAQAPLSDARLAALMNWLVQRFTGKRPKPAYTAQEVGQLRMNPLRDPIAKRNELQQAPPR